MTHYTIKATSGRTYHCDAANFAEALIHFQENVPEIVFGTLALSAPVRHLTQLLCGRYTDAEAFRWLISPQPEIDEAVPLDLIATGRIDELIIALRAERRS